MRFTIALVAALAGVAWTAPMAEPETQIQARDAGYPDRTGPKAAFAPTPPALANCPACAKGVTQLFAATNGAGNSPVGNSQPTTLNVPANAKWAVVDYAFVTTEFPTYVGSLFDDYFEVTIDGIKPNFISTSSSLNETPLIPLAGVGGTSNCYRLSLPVVPGQSITFSLSVANAMDNAFPSAVCGKAYFM